MNATIVVKKIGNHWYPDINHDYPEDLVLDEIFKHLALTTANVSASSFHLSPL